MALRLGRPYGWGVSDDGRTREFLDRFAVTPVAPERYTGTCHPAWPGRAFGGQLAAQSVQAAAAALTDESLHPWSLHILFHAPVASNSRIDYQVLALKEGRTLTSRQVRVEQDGKLRATAVVLFGMTAEGPEHQYQQPDAPPPALVPPEERLIDPTLVAPDADFEELGYPAESLVDLRIVERAERGPADNSAETSDGYLRKAWMRVIPDLPDDPITAAATLCYLSDITLGTTALQPHGGRSHTTELQLGAVELALWFTGPATLSEWTMFAQDTAFAGRGHGLAHGVFFNSRGEVSAVAMQNALMRRR